MLWRNIGQVFFASLLQSFEICKHYHAQCSLSPNTARFNRFSKPKKPKSWPLYHLAWQLVCHVYADILCLVFTCDSVHYGKTSLLWSPLSIGQKPCYLFRYSFANLSQPPMFCLEKKLFLLSVVLVWPYLLSLFLYALSWTFTCNILTEALCGSLRGSSLFLCLSLSFFFFLTISLHHIICSWNEPTGASMSEETDDSLFVNYLITLPSFTGSNSWMAISPLCFSFC